MKKLLFAFASFALVSSAFAQDGADMKWNSELRFRFTGTENAGFNKASTDTATVQRTKIGATMTKGEDLTATVTLLQAATWGNAATAGNTSGELTAGDTDNDVSVYEAFVFWKAMDNVALKIGRGALDLADGSVVAKNDWEQRPYAFEGVYGAYFTEWANIGLFGVKGMNDDATNNPDINFYGLSVDVKNLPEWLKMLNVHALQSKATNVDATDLSDEKLRLGVTLKGDVSAVDYRATYAMYTGEQADAGTTTDHKASMMDLEVGFTMADVMNMRIHGLYHTDSGEKTGGDLEGYDPFFYEKHANAGLMDLIGWGNSTYMKVGIALEPAEMTKVGADYYMFTKTESADSVYNNSHSAITAIGTASGDDVGTELDLWATRALSNGAELNARIGMFSADNALGANAEDVTDFSVGATFKF